MKQPKSGTKPVETLLETFAQWRRTDAAPAARQRDEPIGPLLEYLVGNEQLHRIFDHRWYVAAHALTPAAARNVAGSYLKNGVPQGLDPTSWFSETFYRDAYPDVRAGIAAGQWRCGYQHYLLRGIAEGRSPNASFNELGYLGGNADVSGIVQRGAIPNGLLHYLRYGESEGRPVGPANPDPLLMLPVLPAAVSVDIGDDFAERLYRSINGDVAELEGDTAGLLHWQESGVWEDLRGTRPRLEGWVENLYLRLNPDLGPYIGSAGQQPTGYSHFLMHGAAEGRPWAGSERAAVEARLLDDVRHRRTPLPDLPEGRSWPVISVIVPVYNPEQAALEACIASVLDQTYPHWQLCLADDASTRPHVLETLVAAGEADQRVVLVLSTVNGGISAASNKALEVARGEFVALLDHDDLLAPDALLHLAQAFLSAPEVDLVYTDEAKLTEDGAYVGLNAKPGWSPDLLLSTMYIGHLTAYRRSVIQALGGFRTAFDGTQDYDLALRAAEVVRAVVHVPVPLYFWRMSPASTAGSIGAKPGVLRLQAQALESALVRRGERGLVAPGHAPGHWSALLDPPSPPPLVSIVIPTAGRSARIAGMQVDLVANTIRSLHEAESYPEYEIVVVHNHDLRPETMHLLANFPQVRLVRHHAEGFSFSEMVNLGVQEAAGEYVLLLNDDMQADTPDIITAMMARMYKGVGIVGGRLLFANGTLQHAGIVWTADGPSHAMIGEHRLSPGPAERLRVAHDAFAVTAACMFFRRSMFQELGGLSLRLPVNYNDVEFCLRVRASGLRIVFNPDVTMFHFESVSKAGTHFWELQQLVLLHPGIADPFWNASFSRRSPFYQLDDHDSATPSGYRAWLIDRITRRQAGLTASRGTRFSFVMSVYQNQRHQMEALAETVLRQSYDNWEWVICDDGSTKPETLAWLERIASHPKVRFVRLPENQGIMAGYGAAFAAATGDYVVPIDADDFLTLDCLHVLATAIEARDQPDIVYSDEDKGTESGEVHSPFLKPDWDPVLFTNMCYVCHVCAVKRSTAEAVGAYQDRAASWSHDWDTLLRMKRAGARIEHVPEVLYHWRIHQGSTASIETGTKPHTIDSQRHVLEQDLRLSGADAALSLVSNSLFRHNGIWRLKPRLEALPPSALIVVVSRQAERTQRLLGGLAASQMPPDCLVLLVGRNDGPDPVDPMLAEVELALWPQGRDGAILSLAEAAARCQKEGRLAAVLDADIDRLDRTWLPEGLGMFAAAPDVGAVGGQMMAADGTVVWRGGYAGFGAMLGSPEYSDAADDAGYYSMAWCQRSCDAVPSVCFFARPDLLQQAVAAAAPSTSLRLVAGQVALLARQQALRVVYTPFVQATLASPMAVGPILPQGWRTSFASGPAYYPAAFGTTQSTAYALLDHAAD